MNSEDFKMVTTTFDIPMRELIAAVCLQGLMSSESMFLFATKQNDHRHEEETKRIRSSIFKQCVLLADGLIEELKKTEPK